MSKKKKGFTFIETIVVVGVIALLAAGVVITLNPAQLFEEARDRQREIHLQSILSAVEQRRTVERGWNVTDRCFDLPSGLDATDAPIFKNIGTVDDPSFYDLYSCIVPEYLSTRLYDPGEGSPTDTKYQIWQNPFTGRVTVRYKTDQKEIVAGPAEYWVLEIPTVNIVDLAVFHDRIVVGVDVSHDGGSFVFERGLFWDTIFPPEDINKRTIEGSGTGYFQTTLRNLTPNTVYHIRAYARNEFGYNSFRSPDNERQIRTFTITPFLETMPDVIPSSDRATVGGKLIYRGASDLIGRPYIKYWPRDGSASPVNVSAVHDVAEGQVFSVVLTNLIFDKEYLFQACARNTQGEGCSAPESFRTQVSAPIIGNTVFNINTGVYNPNYRFYNVNADVLVSGTGGREVTEIGVCYTSFGRPTIGSADCVIRTGNFGLNPFTLNVPLREGEIRPNTLYNVIVYARNDVGIGEFSSSFTTPIAPPTIETLGSPEVGGNHARVSGRLLDDGGDTETVVGIDFRRRGTLTWNSVPHGILSANQTFIVELSNLHGATEYEYRAYAVNRNRRVEGQIMNFTTLPSPPTVAITGYDVASNLAFISANVLSDGGRTVTGRGVCFEEGVMPVFDPASPRCISFVTGGTGPFEIQITNLRPGTAYNIIAYAINEVGVATVSGGFTTLVIRPTVRTNSVTNFSFDWAEMGGTLTSDGGGLITESGVCWSRTAINPNPSPGTAQCRSDGNQLSGGTGSSFTMRIEGLDAGIQYSVSIYAINSIGRSDVNAVTFTTAPPQVPDITTSLPTSVTRFTAVSGGSNINRKGADIISKGVCWRTTDPDPEHWTFSPASCTNDGSGIANFTSNITGLAPNTTYFVRAYAQNSAGFGFDSRIGAPSFTTHPLTVAALQTLTPTNIQSRQVTSGALITDDGGVRVTEVALCHSDFDVNPPLGPGCARVTGTWSTGATVNITITGLRPGANYHMRAYAINSVGTGTAVNTVTFRALTEPPSITAPLIVTNTQGFSAVLRYTLNSDGGESATDTGVCFRTTAGITFPCANTVVGGRAPNLPHTFDVTLGNLLPNTTYFARSFATNPFHQVLSSEMSFTTPIVAPVLNNLSLVNRTITSLEMGANITNTGGVNVIERGFAFSSSMVPVCSPTIKTDFTFVSTTGTFGTGNYSQIIGNLSSNTNYNVVAFAINAQGRVGCTPSQTFLTLTPSAPQVSNRIIQPADVTYHSALAGGTLTDSGGDPATVVGIVYCRSTDCGIPRYQDCHLPTVHCPTTTWSAPLPSNFNLTLSNLTPGFYRYRAFAVNPGGVAQGVETHLEFEVVTRSPVVAYGTPTASSITGTSATINGNITSHGGATITSVGACFSTTNNNPRIGGTGVTCDSNSVSMTTGTFNVNITNLIPGTTYHVNVFATNSAGTSYNPSPVNTFTTLAVPPTVAYGTPTASSITSTSATINGNITSHGGATITSVGACFSTTNTNPRIDGTGVTCTSNSVSITTGTFNINISALSPGTQYHVNVFATNSAGTSYNPSPVNTFTTLAVPPTVAYGTPTASSITGTSATINGNVTSHGGATITSVGACFSTTNTNPRIGGAGVTCTSNSVSMTTGTFNVNITNLIPGTTYHVNVFATNSAGTSYNPSPVNPFNTTNRVFITSTTHNGNLGGVVGANAICQTRANERNLGGTWAAWISTTNYSPATHFSRATVPYRLLNGTIIANNWTDLTDGTIQHGINLSELGTDPGWPDPWTGTSVSGVSLTNTCGNWTSAGTCLQWDWIQGEKSGWWHCSVYSHYGAGGVRHHVENGWTYWSDRRCGDLNRLYCFEQ